MTRTRTAAAAAAALLLGGPLLAGCGIKPTGVIESGAAAKVIIPGPGTLGTVYFVMPDGRLAPVPEQDQPAKSPVSVLMRLLIGPLDEEKAAGLETRVPAPADRKPPFGLSAGVSGDVLEVRLPFAVAGLSDTARRQLVCTAASTNPKYTVVLRGPDTSVGPARCELDD
ncbi:Lipoprotein LpqB, GerMN domain-containing protein [Actinobacteria bacterium OV450]|nr:Lipoprotein LpqB, GerMN domain-containing protein [Actinobacteria bacterium OV450]